MPSNSAACLEEIVRPAGFPDGPFEMVRLDMDTPLDAAVPFEVTCGGHRDRMAAHQSALAAGLGPGAAGLIRQDEDQSVPASLQTQNKKAGIHDHSNRVRRLSLSNVAAAWASVAFYLSAAVLTHFTKQTTICDGL
jgi:hypothetical protein